MNYLPSSSSDEDSKEDNTYNSDDDYPVDSNRINPIKSLFISSTCVTSKSNSTSKTTNKTKTKKSLSEHKKKSQIVGTCSNKSKRDNIAKDYSSVVANINKRILRTTPVYGKLSTATPTNLYNNKNKISYSYNKNVNNDKTLVADVEYSKPKAGSESTFKSQVSTNNSTTKRNITNTSNKMKSNTKTNSNTSEGSGGKRGLDRFFRIEPCFYNHSIYHSAALVLLKFRNQLGTINCGPPLTLGMPSPLSTASKRNSDTGNETLGPPSVKSQRPSVSDPANVVTPVQLSPVANATNADATLTGTSNFLDIEVIIEPVLSPGITVISSKPKEKLNFRSSLEKRRVYELSFRTLKFESILDKIMEEVGFLSIYPDLRDCEDLVRVIFCDYVKRKFQKRSPINLHGDEHIAECEEIETAIMSFKTKLNAAVARVRIRNGVRALELLLSGELRIMEAMASVMPVYAWVNYLKLPLERVNNELHNRGFRRVPNTTARLASMEYTNDKHCSDLYVFATVDKQALSDMDMMLNREMVIQDKSSCMAVHVLMANVIANEELAVINPTTVLTAVHLESLMLLKFGSAEPLPPIRIFKPNSKDKDEINGILQSCGTKACKIVYEDLVVIDATQEKYRTIKHTLVQSKDSRSAVIDPIDFLVTEGDDISILKDCYLRAQTNEKPLKVAELTCKNIMLIRQSIHFNRSRTIVYLTNSVYEEENESLTIRALDLGNKSIMKDAEKTRIDPFWIIPPSIPVAGGEVEDDSLLNGKYIRVEPSELGNGYFITLLLRDSVNNQMLNNPEFTASPNIMPDDAPEVQEKGGKKKKKNKQDNATDNN